MPLGEVEHHPLERPLVHLPVCDRHPGLRHETSDLPRRRIDVCDPVVDVEDLALSEQLASDGLGHGTLVGLADIGQDRPTIHGWRGDHREVPDARQRHLEGPRDRTRREGEDVHALADPLDRLLVADAEALLLVDHEQAKILELDALREEPVRTHHDVDGAGSQACQHCRRLGVG